MKSLALCSDKACIKTEPLAFSERPNHDDKSVGMITLKSAWMDGVTALVIILNQLMPFVLTATLANVASVRKGYEMPCDGVVFFENVFRMFIYL